MKTPNGELTKIDSSLFVAADESGAVFLGMEGYRKQSGITTAHLYQVTLSRDIDGAYPVVSTYLVLSPDKAGAIDQVMSCAFPEKTSVYLSEEQRNSITATATRVPLHIRGWGRRVF